MYCRKCGIKLPDDAVFCPKCGTKCINADEVEDNTSNVPKTVKETGLSNTFGSKGIIAVIAAVLIILAIVLIVRNKNSFFGVWQGYNRTGDVVYTFAKDKTMRMYQQNDAAGDIIIIQPFEYDNDNIFYYEGSRHHTLEYKRENDRLRLSGVVDTLGKCGDAPKSALPQNKIESINGVYLFLSSFSKFEKGYYLFKTDGSYAHSRAGFPKYEIKDINWVITGRYEIEGNKIKIFTDGSDEVEEYYIEVGEDQLVLFTEQDGRYEGEIFRLVEEISPDSIVLSGNTQVKDTIAGNTKMETPADQNSGSETVVQNNEAGTDIVPSGPPPTENDFYSGAFFTTYDVNPVHCYLCPEKMGENYFYVSISIDGMGDFHGDGTIKTDGKLWIDVSNPGVVFTFSLDKDTWEYELKVESSDWQLLKEGDTYGPFFAHGGM